MYLFIFAIPITCLCTLIWFDNSCFFYVHVDMSSEKNNNSSSEKNLMETSNHAKNESSQKHYNKKKEGINRKRRLVYQENSEQIGEQIRE